jgi:gas vesicle protein
MKLSEIRDLSKDDVLAAFGLATKPSTAGQLFGSLGLFATGLLVGAGVALLLAPKSGQDLREDLGERLRSIRNSTTSGNEIEGSNDDQYSGSGLNSREEVRT